MIVNLDVTEIILQPEISAAKVLVSVSVNEVVGGGHIIADETQDFPQQPKLKFVGATVTNGVGETVVTIPSGGAIDSISFGGDPIAIIDKDVDLQGVVAKYNGGDIIDPDSGQEISADVYSSVVSLISEKANKDKNGNQIDSTYATKTEIGLKANLVDGKVPSTELPSFVDDVLEVANFAALPLIGESGKIYITIDNNTSYRWSGSAYVSISNPLDYATQIEAEVGTENTKVMTALRVLQSWYYQAKNYVISELNTVSKTLVGAINELFASVDLKQTVFTGICQQQYLTENDIVIDNTALTLTIATVKNGTAISALNPICFYTDGSGIAVKHTINAPVVFNFTDTTGIWYFYFNSAGVAVATQSPWDDFATIATVFRFYWNSTLAIADKCVIQAVEFHKNDISWTDHDWKHGQGTQWITGFEISSNKISSGAPAIDGSNAVIALSTGKNIDDNLEYTVTNAQTGNVKFTQNLGTGLLPATSGKFITISNDSVGRLLKIPATDFPFLWNPTTNIPQYLTATGVRTDVSPNYFFVYYIYALQDPRYGETIKIKSAEIEFANVNNANAHSWEQLQAIFPTLKDNEIRLLYKLTFEYRTSYNVGTKKTALRNIDDLRKQKITSTAVASGSLPATSVTFAPFGGVASTNVQSAIEELDTEKVPTSRTINGLDLAANRSLVESIGYAMSDNTSDITAGVKISAAALPYAFTLTGVRAQLGRAATGTLKLTIDIKVNTVSIFSTLLTFDLTELVTETAAIPYVFTSPTFNLLTSDTIELIVSQAGGVTQAARNLTLFLIGYKTI